VSVFQIAYSLNQERNMKNIKAYTEDLDNNITFNYRVKNCEVEDLVEDLERENLTVEVSE